MNLIIEILNRKYFIEIDNALNQTNSANTGIYMTKVQLLRWNIWIETCRYAIYDCPLAMCGDRYYGLYLYYEVGNI